MRSPADGGAISCGRTEAASDGNAFGAWGEVSGLFAASWATELKTKTHAPKAPSNRVNMREVCRVTGLLKSEECARLC